METHNEIYKKLSTLTEKISKRVSIEHQEAEKIRRTKSLLSEEGNQKLTCKDKFSIYYSKFHKTMKKICLKPLDSSYGNIVIILACMVSLFGNDMQTLCFPPSASDTFSTISNVIFFIPTFDFFSRLWFEQKYVGKFLFYLDLFGVLSSIPDTPFLVNLIFHNNTTGTGNLVQASSSSDVGAKASRYLKFIRLLSFMKIVRLAKVLETAKHNKSNDTETQNKLKKKLNSSELRRKRMSSRFLRNLGKKLFGPQTVYRKSKEDGFTALLNTWINMGKAQKAQINNEPAQLEDHLNSKNIVICLNQDTTSLLVNQTENPKSNSNNSSMVKQEELKIITESDSDGSSNKNLDESTEKRLKDFFLIKNEANKNPISRNKIDDSFLIDFNNPIKTNLEQIVLPHTVDVNNEVKTAEYSNPDLKDIPTTLNFTRKAQEETNDIVIKTPVISPNFIQISSSQNQKENIIESKTKEITKPEKVSPFLKEFKMLHSKRSKNVADEQKTKLQLIDDNNEANLDALINVPIENKVSPDEINLFKITNCAVTTRTNQASIKLSRSTTPQVDSNSKINKLNDNNVSSSSLKSSDEMNNSVINLSNSIKDSRENLIKSLKNSIQNSHMKNEKSISKLNNSGDKNKLNKIFKTLNEVAEAKSKEIPSLKKMPTIKIFKKNQPNLTKEDEEEEEKKKESLEDKLSTFLTNKLVSVILLILILFPVFDISYISQFTTSYEDMLTTQHFCLRSLDRAFKSAIEDPSLIGAVNHIYSYCLNAAEDGNPKISTLNITDIQNETDIQAMIDSVSPFYLAFNFTNYPPYYTLQSLISNSTNYTLFDVAFVHPIFNNMTEMRWEGSNYFTEYYDSFLFEDATIMYVYNTNAIQNLTNTLNLIKIVFIAFVLVYGSHNMTGLITYYVARPLDKLIARLKYNLGNPDTLNEEINSEDFANMEVKDAYMKALLLIEDSHSEKTNLLSRNAEIFEFDKTMKILMNLVSLSGAGKQSNNGYLILVLNLINSDQNKYAINIDLKKEGLKYNAVILMMRFDNVDKFLKEHGQGAFQILNTIYTVFHSEGLIHMGDISSNRSCIIWKENKEKIIENFTNYVLTLGKNKHIKININLDKDRHLQNENTNSKEKSENNNKIFKDESNNVPKSNDVNVPPNKLEYCKANIINLSFLCATRILTYMHKSLNKAFKVLDKYGVKVNLFLNYGEVINGYGGHDTKIEEVFLSGVFTESKKILKKMNFRYPIPSIFIKNNYANLLSDDLYDLVFPCEIVYFPKSNGLKTVRIYKLFFDPTHTTNTRHSKDEFKRDNIISKRRKLRNELTAFNKKLEEYIIVDDQIEEDIIKHIPYDLFCEFKKLFNEFQKNRLRESLTIVEKINAREDFGTFSDVQFKLNFKNIENSIKEKLLIGKINRHACNYTITL